MVVDEIFQELQRFVLGRINISVGLNDFAQVIVHITGQAGILAKMVEGILKQFAQFGFIKRIVFADRKV
jgi:hypothetical protein